MSWAGLIWIIKLLQLLDFFSVEYEKLSDWLQSSKYASDVISHDFISHLIFDNAFIFTRKQEWVLIRQEIALNGWHRSISWSWSRFAAFPSDPFTVSDPWSVSVNIWSRWLPSRLPSQFLYISPVSASLSIEK